eukprot:746762-Hanusia_phi.AAC.1
MSWEDVYFFDFDVRFVQHGQPRHAHLLADDTQEYCLGRVLHHMVARHESMAMLVFLLKEGPVYYDTSRRSRLRSRIPFHGRARGTCPSCVTRAVRAGARDESSPGVGATDYWPVSPVQPCSCVSKERTRKRQASRAPPAILLGWRPIHGPPHLLPARQALPPVLPRHARQQCATLLEVRSNLAMEVHLVMKGVIDCYCISNLRSVPAQG